MITPIPVPKTLYIYTLKKTSAYRIFLRITDFDPENVVQQPVDGLLLVEHEDELNNEVQVWSLEHFSCRERENGRTGAYKCSLNPHRSIKHH